MTCSCGRPVTCIADLSGWGLYIRVPVCGPSCKHVRASALCCDVVVEPEDMIRVITARACWCGMARKGRHVTWCPRHGELDVVQGMCS